MRSGSSDEGPSELRIVIDRAAIEEVERRRRGEAACEPRWRRWLVWASCAGFAGLAGLAGWSIVTLLAARPIGPLAAMLAELTWASQRAAAIGVVAVVATVIARLRLRRTRHFRWIPALVAHGAGFVAGAAALVLGLVHWFALSAGGGARYTSMPERPALDVPVQIERIVSATVVVLAPDAAGDARAAALGTGAIVAADDRRAWILTCSHVAMPYASPSAFRRADRAQPVWVQLSDGREGRAAVRWTAPPPLDVALLELPIASAPAPVPVSVDGAAPAVGESVLFVPNPYRAGWLVRHGTLLRRATHRTPAGVYDLLHTDLPVTHGDSGSGLFDAQGRLVGLNTWTHVDGGGRARGISLPATAMRALVDAIERDALDQLDDVIDPEPGE